MEIIFYFKFITTLTIPNLTIMMRYLLVTLLLFAPMGMYSQMAVHSNLYIGADHEVYDAFDVTSFHSGVVTIDRNGGIFSFAPNASWENSDSSRHLDGRIRKYGPSAFTFPSGHGGQYQPIHFSQVNGDPFLDISFVAIPHIGTNLSLDLRAIHTGFYWSIHNAAEQGRLTLSWNANNNMTAFLDPRPVSSLTIAGFKQGSWHLINSLVDNTSMIDSSNSDFLSGSITSVDTFDLNSYSAFTIGVKKVGGIAAEYVRVAEGVTPNNDGVNDFWVIHGIEDFPLAKVNVYNRLGKEVYTSGLGYDNSWTGTFRGNIDPLPVGPYFYTIDFEADGQTDLQGWMYINY